MLVGLFFVVDLPDPLVVVLESDLNVDMRVFCKAKKLPLESWSSFFGLLAVKIVRQIAIVSPDLVQVCFVQSKTLLYF